MNIKLHWCCEFESLKERGYSFLVSVVCFTDRGFCDGPITRSGESYRVCVCVCVCVYVCV